MYQQWKLTPADDLGASGEKTVTMASVDATETVTAPSIDSTVTVSSASVDITETAAMASIDTTETVTTASVDTIETVSTASVDITETVTTSVDTIEIVATASVDITDTIDTTESVSTASVDNTETVATSPGNTHDNVIDIADTVAEAAIVSPSSLGHGLPDTTEDSQFVDQQTMEYSEWTIDYDFTQPKMIVHQSEEYMQFQNNYLKGCKWSPDGSCLLTNSNDNKLRLYNLPNSLWNGDVNVDKMELALTIQEGGLVYDYCWFPHMSSHNPDSCVLATSSRGLPVRLWDAFTGESRCSYRPYNHADELISAQSIAFNNSGDKLYCGFTLAIRVFDTARPGRECQFYNYKSTKKQQVRGQPGLMSSISFHADDTMFAVGSYLKTVGLYSSETGKCVRVLRGHASGVTQVKFLPNGNHLLSGTRKDNEIFCWDIRYPRAPVSRVERLVVTNQRIQFDTDRSGRYLVSGSHDGRLNFWDLNAEPAEDSDLIRPVCEVPAAHSETVNGANFHPFLPVVSSASGQHHSQSETLCSGGESHNDSDSDEDQQTTPDNSLKLWWLGKNAMEMKAD